MVSLKFRRSTCLLSLLLLSGCSSLSYISQASFGQLALYNRQKPLKEAIEDPQLPSEIREKLLQMPRIKEYVEKTLGVKATSNYMNYVDLKRPYVVWALTVAEKNQLKTFDWSFPLVGTFPYLGFFEQATAEQWAREYRTKGYDTSIRGVPAYSTLGFLPEPLLSSMMQGELSDLVNLIFHETTHSIVYADGQGSFNEQIASLIGDQGERLWIEENHGFESAQFKAWLSQREDRKTLGQLLRGFADQLNAFYASARASSGSEIFKEEMFRNFKEKIRQASWKDVRNRKWADRISNNADLLAVLTYDDDQDFYEKLYQKNGQGLSFFLSWVKSEVQEWERLQGLPGAAQIGLKEFFQSRL